MQREAWGGSYSDPEAPKSSILTRPHKVIRNFNKTTFDQDFEKKQAIAEAKRQKWQEMEDKAIQKLNAFEKDYQFDGKKEILNEIKRNTREEMDYAFEEKQRALYDEYCLSLEEDARIAEIERQRQLKLLEEEYIREEYLRSIRQDNEEMEVYRQQLNAQEKQAELEFEAANVNYMDSWRRSLR
eukprot:TRINITY_DN2094_c0_g1_i1.p1 TRINITY_DN2094_c0_g1~~TRINITY_DN2094_c0_g1_i1.p1  ORF type:complete len:198 (+),score=71.97 TRINITY_DN2094_c0_g1_i1:43-594(+)